MEFTTVVLPSIFASYLINNDSSSLEQTEITELENFIDDNNLGSCLDVSENEYFSWNNDLYPNLGATVSDFTFEQK